MSKKKKPLTKKQRKANRKANQKKYDASPKGKASTKKYNQSPKGKKTRQKYKNSPKGQATRKKNRQSATAKANDELLKQKRIALKEQGDETLYIYELWRGTVNNAKKHDFVHEHPTFKTYWNLWVKQKKEFGYCCPYTGNEFTWIRWNNSMGNQRPLGNVSCDQLAPKKGYTKTKGRKRSNIVFCTWGANIAKRDLPPEVMKMVVHIYENGLKNPNPKKKPTKEEVGITKLRKWIISEGEY
jgi:hypothetical protein